MMLYAVRYTLEYGPGTLLRSLTPGILFGAGPPDYQSAEELGLGVQGTSAVGDEAAKQVTPLDITCKYIPHNTYPISHHIVFCECLRITFHIISNKFEVTLSYNFTLAVITS